MILATRVVVDMLRHRDLIVLTMIHISKPEYRGMKRMDLMPTLDGLLVEGEVVEGSEAGEEVGEVGEVALAEEGTVAEDIMTVMEAAKTNMGTLAV